MATKSAVLAVKIVSDASQFSKGTDAAASSLDKFKGKIKSLTVPALAVGGGLLAVGTSFGKMASDFEQNSGAVDAVFKGMSKQIDDFASKSAKGMGLSANSYKESAALIGSQLKNAGVPMDQLVTKTDNMIKMGADFSAQFGGTVPEAVDAMSSALKGEMDPIEKYGITLNDAMIKAEMSTTGASKAQAIMNLIQKQGADAIGANAREAGTAAGAQARLQAAYEGMGVQLGQVLLPIMTKAAEILSSVVDWVSKNQQLVTVLAVGLGILAAAVLVLNVAMIAMNIIAALNPFVLIGVAVVALIAFIIYLATQTTVFQTIWAAVSQFCADVWNGFVGFITDVWNGFMGFIQDAVNNVGGFFSDTLGNIGKWFSDVFNGAGRIVDDVVGGITSAFDSVSTAVQNAINWVSSLFNGFSVPGWMKDVMNFMGMGGAGFDMAVGMDLAGLPAGMGATGTMPTGFLSGGGSNGRTEITNVSITVEGALDPDAVGRQISKYLDRYSRNSGRTAAAGGF